MASDGVRDFARLASLGIRESGVDALDRIEPVKEDLDFRLVLGEGSRAALEVFVLPAASNPVMFSDGPSSSLKKRLSCCGGEACGVSGGDRLESSRMRLVASISDFRLSNLIGMESVLVVERVGAASVEVDRSVFGNSGRFSNEVVEA